MINKNVTNTLKIKPEQEYKSPSILLIKCLIVQEVETFLKIITNKIPVLIINRWNKMSFVFINS